MMETRAYSYDFFSRMTQLVDTNGSVFVYAFDGEGNRTKQMLNDCLETRFVYDGNNVVLELNANNDVVYAYVNGPEIDEPVERISFVNGSPRQWRTFHRDALGSVVGLSDENGALVQSYAYAAFGAIRTQTGADLNRITYTAREALGDSAGLYYYRYRTYNPALGRFLSEDPLGFIDGPNRYIYVRNNPLRWIDPFGLAGFNATPCPVPIKPENGTNVIIIPPWTGWTNNQDGIASPFTHPNQVYKTVNDVDVFVFPDGEVVTFPKSVRAAVGMGVKGGWKGRDWQNKLHKRKTPDHGWDNLFNSSCP